MPRFTILIVFVIGLLITTHLFAINIKKQSSKNIKEYIYYEKGMRHHLVVMNKNNDEQNLSKINGRAAVVIDTIQHAHVDFPEFWDEGIQDFTVAGDTLTNWYWFASDTARLLEIHASFSTTGTGSWNAWKGVYKDQIGVVPNTAISYLPLNVPWTITKANINAQQKASGEWQVYKLGVLEADIPEEGAFIGYFTDGANGPKMFMDDGDHLLDDFDWFPSRTYLSDQPGGGWFFWANDVTWTEYVQRIVVSYTRVAPLITFEQIADYFVGNPEFDKIKVNAEVVDLDGTVASVNVHWKIGENGSENSAPMILKAGDVYSGQITGPFSARQTIKYWISATDNDGNLRESSDKEINVLPLPKYGTDYLLVNEGGRLGIGVFETALDNLGIEYYTWDIEEHHGISNYEINYSFGSIIWTGFGSDSLPSPFESGTHPIKTALDNGKNLLIVDNDYLFTHGFESKILTTLSSGQFGYDYLGLSAAISDPSGVDSVFYGHDGDPVGAGYVSPNSFKTYPTISGIWSRTYNTDWQDIIVPNGMASPTFYNFNYNETNNYNNAIRYSNGTFATAFFSFSIETAEENDFETVLSNTLNWMQSINPTAIKDKNEQLLSHFKLEQNYPNPFNPETIIRYQLPQNSQVRLKIFNISGEEIATLINKKQGIGEHNVTFNGANLASGIYFYQLEVSASGHTGKYVQSRKMILLK